MEGQRFDNLSRMMANGASRRTVLRGVVGGALAAVGLRGGAAAKLNKVDICHRTGNGSYHHINVSVNALNAHLRHGDRTADHCEGNFELDFATCECACDTDSLGCSGNEVVDPDSCSCVCGSTSCDAGQVLNPDNCECVCDTTGVVCSGHEVIDPDTCECVCNWECHEWLELDPVHCECIFKEEPGG